MDEAKRLEDPNGQNIPKESQSQQEKEITKSLICWIGLDKYEEQFGFVVQEIDISIACQYSGNQIKMPARSESCDVSCLIEKDIIEQTLTCSCGKQIDEQNYYVQDWQLLKIVQFIKKKYGIKVKMVRLSLIEKRFWPV